ncbi:MAG: hypothetical protein A3F40_00720 [Chlamydiae bacterium RIFCSPHIGHO2_12_FULL_27_8]|nr:MAG: hypothetical protein A3F40_00720 [Chlamydiae bacterium RIFCSPHIGHO2_12_FULL_27_8]
MIKKAVFILFLLSTYIYIVSSDPNGSLLDKTKKFYSQWMTRYKKMNLKYHVNTWPNKNKKRYY